MRGIQYILASVLFLQTAPVSSKDTRLKFSDLDKKSETMTLAEGKTYVFQAWASWCVSCSDTINKIHGDLEVGKSENLEFVTVTIDEATDPAKAYMSKHADVFSGLGLKAYMDPAAKELSQFKLEGIPATIIIKPNGETKVLHGRTSREKIREIVFGQSH